MMFWGLMSRWMMPRLWAWPSARTIWVMKWSASRQFRGAPFFCIYCLSVMPSTQLHDDIVQLVGMAHVVHGDDIGVGEHGDGLRFVVEAAAELRVAGKLRP